jgi:hypothetical protein
MESIVRIFAKKKLGGTFHQFFKADPTINDQININLLTKCYNTATILLYALTLSKESIRQADMDCHSKLHSSHIPQKDKVERLVRLREDILKPDCKPCIYYILMNVEDFVCPRLKNKTSDNNRSKTHYKRILGNYGKQNIEAQTENENNTTEEKTFPGHVFILEKAVVWNKKFKTFKNVYYIYQSYINSYVLEDFHNFNKQTFKVSQSHVKRIMDSMIKLFITKQWTQETSDFWKLFTHVNSEKFNGCNIGDIKPCSLKFYMKDVVPRLHNYCNRRLNIIKNYLTLKKQKQKYEQNSFRLNNLIHSNARNIKHHTLLKENNVKLNDVQTRCSTMENEHINNYLNVNFHTEHRSSSKRYESAKKSSIEDIAEFLKETIGELRKISKKKYVGLTKSNRNRKCSNKK